MLLYSGISGVLHPSESLYGLVHGRSWADGHAKYEGVLVLAAAQDRLLTLQLMNFQP